MGKLLIGDGPTALDAFEPGTVDCVYADPPFGTGRHFGSYADPAGAGWRDLIDRVLHASWRALGEHGSLWLHLDPPGAAWAHQRALDPLGRSSVAAQIVWQRGYSPRSGSGIPVGHDVILVVAKPAFRPRPLPRTDDQDNLFVSWDGDPDAWSSADLTAPRADANPAMVYAIQSPFTGKLHYPTAGRHWVWPQTRLVDALGQWCPVRLERLDDAGHRAALVGRTIRDLPDVPAIVMDTSSADARRLASARLAAGCWPEVFFGRTGAGQPRRKLPRPDAGAVPTTWWPHTQVGHVQQAKTELKAILPGAPFSTPKPEALLERVLQIATDEGSLVVDPFAGSGVTAAVAHKLGRGWVTIEADEQTARQVTLPRVQAACRGDAPATTTRLVARLPHKVHAGEPSRAAAVLRALDGDGRIDLDRAILDRLCRRLCAADHAIVTTHDRPDEPVEVGHVAPRPARSA